MHQTYKDQGLVAVGAGFDWNFPYSCPDWSQTFGLTYPLLNDASMTLINDFAVPYIPYHVILDHTMTVRYAALGWNEQAITDIIETLLAEKSILGTDDPSGDRRNILPERVTLHPAYPNPFNPTVTVAYSLPVASAVRLEVLDMLGRRVALVVDHPGKSAGRHEVVWNAGDLGSGIYILQMWASGTVRSQKIVLLK